MTDLLERLRAVEPSSLADADKSVAVVDPAVRAIVPDVRMAGPAITVVAPRDHLPVLVALRDAEPGSVLVVDTRGADRAVAGELFATEAARRGLAGVVIDGLCRDVRGLRRVGLPVFARGSTPASGSTRDPGEHGGPVTVGGVTIRPGDLVVGDDDGLVVLTPEQAAGAIDGAEEVERAEGLLLERMAAGEALPGLTTLDEHLEALAAGRDSALGFRV